MLDIIREKYLKKEFVNMETIMYISVNDAATKFNISKRRVQILCEEGRIDGATMVSGVWLIPKTASNPIDKRRKNDNEQISFIDASKKYYNIDEICKILSISKATAKNWIRLGKIIPDVANQLFSHKYIEDFVAKLKSNNSTKLKIRRNKKKVTGKVIYKDYVQTEQNKKLVAELLECDIINSERDLSVVLANFAVQLYYQAYSIQYSDNNILLNFLSQEHISEFHILVKDLIGNHVIDSDLINKLQPALTKKILFVRGEDSLGFIYISFLDISKRKISGAYYTPEKVINELIDRLYENDINLKSKKICDPCCGTGNFLLRLASMGIDCSNIYGQDIDPISVYLSRINIALMNPRMSASEIRTRVIIGNTYFETFTQKFDVILGNPPWGSELSAEDTLQCSKFFKTVASRRIEPYDLFVEKALAMLNHNGIMAFILPEAILSVAAHDIIRRIILKSCSFKFITYLGNVFSGVQCPAIILGITPDNRKTVVGCKVITKNNRFIISNPRIFPDGMLILNVSDEENQCLDAISNIKNAAYLKENAKFALGIVTGNNKKYISKEKYDDNEIVLKGSDIQRYGIMPSGNYIRFVPNSFQQVAPVEMYRAEAKLLYRFISELPVFTYDDKKTLSLNSCNIVIPEIDGLEMKYILAILNSRVAAYFISKKFNSVKLLRSHLEKMPIPIVPKEIQFAIVKKVDLIMNSSGNIRNLYNDLDRDIMTLYGLTVEQADIIQTALRGKKLFLPGAE